MSGSESTSLGFGLPPLSSGNEAPQPVSIASTGSSLGLDPMKANGQPPGVKGESFAYIIETVFNQIPNSDLSKALLEHGCESYLDLIGMDDQDIDSLQYPRDQLPDENGDPVPPVMSPVKQPLRVLLHGLKGYVHYRLHKTANPIDLYNCMSITYDEFINYRASCDFMVYNNKMQPNPLVNNSQHKTPVEKFQRLIKAEVSHYPVYKDDKDWDAFNRRLKALAFLHGIDKVLDPNYIPVGTNAKELFQLQETLLYNVFMGTLLTNTGKQLVRQHEDTMSAQAVYAGLVKHAKQSPHPANPHELAVADFLSQSTYLSTGSEYGTHDTGTEDDGPPSSEPPPSDGTNDPGTENNGPPSLESPPSDDTDDPGTKNGEPPSSEPPPSDMILAHVTKQRSFQPGELGRVMSDKLASTPVKHNKPSIKAKKHDEIEMLGQQELVASKHNFVYKVQKPKLSTSVKQAIVDHDANGGICGTNLLVLDKTSDRFVDVQGIDNHQLTNIPIVTCAGYTETPCGPVIVIFHQFAYTGKGHSILSCGQMEHFGISVDNKSAKVGGTQQISTPDGFVFPIEIRNGLPCLHLRPPTKREMDNNTIPQVVLTADGPTWNPSALDSSFDDIEAWANSIPDDEPPEGERPFDQVDILESNKTVIGVTFTNVESIENHLLDSLEEHDCVLPSDALYDAIPRPRTSLDWREVNMANLLPTEPPLTKRLDPVTTYDVIQVQRKKPSVLFVPEITEPTSLDSAFLTVQTKTMDLTLIPQPPTRRSQRLLHLKDGKPKAKLKAPPIPPPQLNGKQPRPRPPPPADPPNGEHKQSRPPLREEAHHEPLPEPVYKNPSSAVRSRERDWERLSKYFAWLPKLVIQRTFDYTKMKAPSIVGIAEHVGHGMTYKILKPDIGEIFSSFFSVREICSVEDTKDPNRRLTSSDGERCIESRSDNITKIVYSSGDGGSDSEDAFVHNKDLIGRTFFFKPDEEGHVFRAQLVDLVDTYIEDIVSKPEHRKFRVRVNNDEYDEVMAYNKILEGLEAEEKNPIIENPTVWKLKQIVFHQGPLRLDHSSYMGSTYNASMELENGEITPKQLNVIAADDSVTCCALYARDKTSLDASGWKRFRSIAKRHKKLLRMVNHAKLCSFCTAEKYMYGSKIPKNYEDGLRLDRLHGNTKWQGCIKVEMDQLKEYNVSNGHLTKVPAAGVYSGVVSTTSLKMMIFLAELNGLELWYNKVTIIAEPCPRQGHLDRAKRICEYLQGMKNACIRFRTGLPDYSDVSDPVSDWADSMYGSPEEFPQNAPPPLGLPVTLTHYVDANQYHCELTGQSVTDTIHMLNGTPVDAFSKEQSTVETATCGSELVVARTCVEQIMDLYYTLHFTCPVNCILQISALTSIGEIVKYGSCSIL